MNSSSAPDKAVLYITSRCNLNCPFCYCREFAGNREPDLPAAEWLRFLDELGREKVFRVDILGGEPFCRPDLLLLLERVRANRMRFCIYSNGVLITREQAGYLGRSGRCDRVQLSIDGFEATHDSVRGRGMWKKALAGAALLHRYGVPVTVNVTVGAFNSAEAVGLAHFLNRQEYIDRIIFSRVSAVGREWPERLRPLTIPETARLIRQFERDRKELPKVLPGSFVYRFLNEIRRGTAGGSPARRCGEVWNTLAVRADGVMIPCRACDRKALGRINADSVARIWRNSAERKALLWQIGTGRAELPESSCDAGCEFAWYCRQYCPSGAGGRICRKELKKLLKDLL